MPESKSDIGLIGLAVMGQNLVLNMADHGYKVSVYNRTTSKMTEFIDEVRAHEPSAERVVGHAELEDFVKSIKTPRKIVLMVQSTAVLPDDRDAVDKVVDSLRPFIDKGDILIDGGNSNWNATIRRDRELTQEGFEFIGTDGAGHYVKMVHNGIEYIDMQLICEAYQVMKDLLGMKPDEMSKVFADWNSGLLDSFLIEITADILQQKDPTNKRKWFVDVVLDAAGQKGTGKWTSISALDLGIPANSIAEAVFARCLSAIKEERVAASKKLKGPKDVKPVKGKKKLIEAIHDALYSSKICAYAQGFQLMAAAQDEYDWKLDFAEIAKIFRGGCIIRARFLQKITEAYQKDPKLQNLMLDPFFKKELHRCQDNWRKVVSLAVLHGVPTPAFSSALAYFDGYRSAVVPANLLQAQRDYFGAHTYERVDQPRGKKFHIDWPEADRPQLKV
jgi:6-phosphogluconate dehydrogenase